MSINWSLLQPVDIGGMFQKGYQQGQQMVEQARVKSALAAFSQDPTNPEALNALAAASPEFAMKLGVHRMDVAQKEAERQRLGAYFAQDDFQTSRKQALAAGDIDVAKELASLDENERKRAIDEAKGAAPFLYEAQKLPYEQRKPFLQSQAAALAQVGFTQEEIDAYDPTDANNAGILSLATTLDQAREMDRVRWAGDPAGGQFPIDYWGRDVRSGGPGSGGGSVRPPASAGATDPLAPQPQGGEFRFNPVPGAQQTSGYRSPADNERVGGVANSYHLTDQARDFTPPPGMSMAQLHAKLSAANPDLDVINEGDHVHIEPKSRDQFAGGGRPQTGDDKLQLIRQAREAIAAGAPEAQVIARLQSMGVTL
jgi:hypothetical protein